MHQLTQYWHYYFNNFGASHLPTVFISLFTAIPIIIAKRVLPPHIPYLVIIIGVVTGITHLGGYDVVTLGEKYGNLSFDFPELRFPFWSFTQVLKVLPYATTLAFLGVINSLLTVVSVHQITNKSYDSRAELTAQGLSNIGVSLFSGLPVSATMVRTITAIKAHAQSPFAAIFPSHFYFDLCFLFRRHYRKGTYSVFGHHLHHCSF